MQAAYDLLPLLKGRIQIQIEEQEKELDKRKNELIVCESDWHRIKAQNDLLGKYKSREEAADDMFQMLKETKDADVQRLRLVTNVGPYISKSQTYDEFIAQHGSISSGENL